MKLRNNRVCMPALGYIGLPIVAILASRGSKVIGFNRTSRRCLRSLASLSSTEFMDANVPRDPIDLVSVLFTNRIHQS